MPEQSQQQRLKFAPQANGNPHVAFGGDRWESLGRRWRLIKLLHQGETSRVYAARPTLSSPYREAQHIVKILRRGCERNRDAIAALRRETQVARLVSHSALVKVVESHLQAAPYYIVFPRIQGESLAARLTNRGAVSIPAALSVTRRIAEALSALHAAGWLHGDIKPPNVLLNANQEVTLIDLAFARPIEHGVLEVRTPDASPRPEPLSGSLAYLPPELLSPSFPATQAADLYSLGVTLFALLTGSLPFSDSQSAQELLARHRDERPVDVRQLRPAIPATVAQLVQSLLAKNPQRRPFSAAEVAEQCVRAEIETFAQRA